MPPEEPSPWKIDLFPFVIDQAGAGEGRGWRAASYYTQDIQDGRRDDEVNLNYLL